MDKNLEFKDIPQFEGKYKINKKGEVYSNFTSKILKTCKRDKRGYICIGLLKNRKQKIFLLHRLLAITFLPNPLKYKCINHKDGNKSNNCLDNLEWCSYSHNNQHAYKTGLQKIKLGGKSHSAILTWEKVKKIRNLYKTTCKSQYILAKLYGVSRGAIQGIIHNTSWVDLNYTHKPKVRILGTNKWKSAIE